MTIERSMLTTTMPDHLRPVLASLPQQPQRQDGLNDQLRDIATFADRLGLYDAADFIRTSIGIRPLGNCRAGR